MSKLNFRSSIKGWHSAFSQANVDQRRVSEGKENEKRRKKSGVAVTLQRESNVEHGEISRVQRNLFSFFSFVAKSISDA